MNNNTQHIKNVNDFYQALKKAKDANAKKKLVEALKKIDTEDDGLKGVLYFLEDHDWGLDVLQNTVDAAKQRLLDEDLPEKVKNKKQYKTYLYVAASLIPLILVAAYYFNYQTNINSFYIKEPGLPVLMNNNSLTKWNVANEYLRAENYPLALEHFKKIDINPNNDTLNYLEGVSNYHLNNYDEAIRSFSNVLQKKSSTFLYDAEFRLGFAYYESGNIEKAEQIFKSIASDEQHPYVDESMAILKALF
jgi:TolA-binding protein